MPIVWNENEIILPTAAAVDIVPAPAAGETQIIGKEAISIFNPNTGNVTVTISKENSAGPVTTRSEKILIPRGQTATNSTRLVSAATTKSIQVKLDASPTLPVEVQVFFGTHTP